MAQLLYYNISITFIQIRNLEKRKEKNVEFVLFLDFHKMTDFFLRKKRRANEMKSTLFAIQTVSSVVTVHPGCYGNTMLDISLIKTRTKNFVIFYFICLLNMS